MSDFLIVKIFRLIDILELEKPGSVIDRINRAEKRGIIDSAESFKDILRLRNDISHEYVPPNSNTCCNRLCKESGRILQRFKRINGIDLTPKKCKTELKKVLSFLFL